VFETQRGVAKGGWAGELAKKRSLTVASLLRLDKRIEVLYRRPTGFLAVKQENPPNGGRIPF
jgi:hypothetical protein